MPNLSDPNPPAATDDPVLVVEVVVDGGQGRVQESALLDDPRCAWHEAGVSPIRGAPPRVGLRPFPGVAGDAAAARASAVACLRRWDGQTLGPAEAALAMAHAIRDLVACVTAERRASGTSLASIALYELGPALKRRLVVYVTALRAFLHREGTIHVDVLAVGNALCDVLAAQLWRSSKYSKDHFDDIVHSLAQLARHASNLERLAFAPALPPALVVEVLGNRLRLSDATRWTLLRLYQNVFFVNAAPALVALSSAVVDAVADFAAEALRSTDDDGLVQWTCGLVKVMAGIDADLDAILANAGLLGAVVEASDRFPGSAVIAEEAAKALRNLSVHESRMLWCRILFFYFG